MGSVFVCWSQSAEDPLAGFDVHSLTVAWLVIAGYNRLETVPTGGC